MLQLFVNSEALDLPNDATITIDEESPVFEKDSIPGGYSFPFTLPITPRNRRILGFPERIEKAGVMSTEQPFQLFHAGVLRLSGTISIKEAGSSYKAYLVVGSGSFAPRIKDKKLKDLDLGGERTWEWLDEYAYPESDFALFPIYNGIYFEATEPEAGYTPTNDNYINLWSGGVFYNDPEATFAICPFPFLGYLIRRIFSQYGFQIMGNVIESNADFRDLCLYTNFDITQADTAVEMVEVFMGTNQYGDEIYETVPQTTITRVIDTFNLVDCLPDMLITDFLLSLRNLLNISFVFDKNDRVWIIQRQDLVFSSVERDITGEMVGIPSVTSPVTTSGFKLSWEIDEHDLLFRDGYKKIDDVLNLLKDPVLDFTELAAITPELNEIRFVGIMDAYYQYAKVGETNVYQWQQYGIGLQNYLDGDMEEVFETKISTLLMATYQIGESAPTMRMPHTDQLRNSIEKAAYQEFTARLLFYRGMQLDSDENPYPMGSNDNLDNTGTLLEGKSLELKWNGDYGFYGLYQILWKKYLTWWMSRKQVAWTVKDPSALAFDKKYAIEGKHYLLKKRTVNLTMRGIEPGECEFYTV